MFYLTLGPIPFVYKRPELPLHIYLNEDCSGIMVDFHFDSHVPMEDIVFLTTSPVTVVFVHLDGLGRPAWST